MLQLLKKLLKLWPFGRHGEPDIGKPPAASSPRASGVFFDKGPRLLPATNGPFPADIIRGAIEAGDAFDAYIWPSVTLAQWALESNYGKAMPKGSNNPFGIKANGDQPSVDAMTWEVVRGKRIDIVQRFRKFETMADAFEAHNRLLATSKHYKKARAAKTAVEFAKALTGIYATDPDYDKKLRSIMGKYNLYQYDRK